MAENWNTKIKNASELEKELLALEVMKLRRQCNKMFDALKIARTELLDLYETPKKELEDRLEKSNQIANSIGVIVGHIEKEQSF